jgi:hypothetical protein
MTFDTMLFDSMTFDRRVARVADDRAVHAESLVDQTIIQLDNP